MLALRARYVLPVESPPVADGTVIVEGERIVELLSGASPPGTVDLGNAAILPGLINAHTHLEFSCLTQPLGRPGMAFSDWIAQVVQWRRRVETTSPVDWRRSAARTGLAESCRAGVTTLADVITAPWPVDAYQQAATGVVALAEYLAPTEPRASDQWSVLCEFLQEQTAEASPVLWGVSPHAAYTVRWEVLPKVCAFSAARQLPLAMHLAESRDELEFLRSRSGPLAAVLQTLGAWDPAAVPPRLAPRDYLEVLSTAHRVLVIHGNYLTSDEIRFVAARSDQMAAVYCPRTHGYFAHGRYPLAEMLKAGVTVALGTDSRASTPDLQLLEEMRYTALNHRAAAPEVIVRLGTLAGAIALGQQHRIGSVVPGKQADLVVIGLPRSGANGPYGFLSDPTCRVERVYRAGKEALRSGPDAGEAARNPGYNARCRDVSRNEFPRRGTAKP